MIGYQEITAALPPERTAEERDAWYAEHGIDPDAVVQLGVEIARIALLRLDDGEKVSETDLVINLTSAFAQGFELGWRVNSADLITYTPDEDGD